MALRGRLRRQDGNDTPVISAADLDQQQLDQDKRSAALWFSWIMQDIRVSGSPEHTYYSWSFEPARRRFRRAPMNSDAARLLSDELRPHGFYATYTPDVDYGSIRTGRL